MRDCDAHCAMLLQGSGLVMPLDAQVWLLLGICAVIAWLVFNVWLLSRSVFSREWVRAYLLAYQVMNMHIDRWSVCAGKGCFEALCGSDPVYREMLSRVLGVSGEAAQAEFSRRVDLMVDGRQCMTHRCEADLLEECSELAESLAWRRWRLILADPKHVDVEGLVLILRNAKAILGLRHAPP